MKSPGVKSVLLISAKSRPQKSTKSAAWRFSHRQVTDMDGCWLALRCSRLVDERVDMRGNDNDGVPVLVAKVS